MYATQPQGQRSGEGTADLWNHIREDDQRKEREPDAGPQDDARQRHSGDRAQQQQQPQRGG